MAQKEGVPGGGQGGACPRAALARRGVSGTRRCGLPSLSPACPAAAVPCGGARLFWLPAYPTFSFVLAPLPRRGRISPLSPSRREGGETKVIFMQGAPPLASPGLNPRGIGSTCRCGSRRGGCVLPRLFFLPYNRFFAPIPPPPLPGGKGETFTLFRRELPPPAPRALNRLRHLQNLPSRCPEGRTRAALLIGNRFLSFLRQTMGSAPGMQGAKPLA